MKHLIGIALMVGIVGCAGTTPVVSKSVITVDKPIPFCPAPPDIPLCPRYVDALSSADATTPGKVVQFINIDLTCLRINEMRYREVLSNYRDLSNMNSSVSTLFDSYGTQYQQLLEGTTVTPAPLP